MNQYFSPWEGVKVGSIESFFLANAEIHKWIVLDCTPPSIKCTYSWRKNFRTSIKKIWSLITILFDILMMLSISAFKSHLVCQLEHTHTYVYVYVCVCVCVFLKIIIVNIRKSGAFCCPYFNSSKTKWTQWVLFKFSIENSQ